MANINKIQLPNGTQYDIEDAVARGKSVMVVTITGEEDPQTEEVTYSADKTYSEIYTHITNGGLALCYYNLEYFQLVYCNDDDGIITFGTAGVGTNSETGEHAAWSKAFYIYDNEVVEFVEDSIDNSSDGIFRVTFGGTDSNPTCDKTFNEIDEAFQNGKVILGAKSWSTQTTPIYYLNANLDDGIFYFTNINISLNYIYYKEYTINYNNQVAYTSNTCIIPNPSATAPVMDGTAAVGTSTNYARADHVHPVSSLSALSDTTITNPADGQVLTYDSTTGKWVNAAADASFDVQIVQTLPTTNIDTHTIYFVLASATVGAGTVGTATVGGSDDVYDEYMYINNAWEKIGSTRLDLSDYAKKTDIVEPVQSNWTEEDTTSLSHVLNRPAIRAGEGENSVLVGQIEQDDTARTILLNISGNLHQTTFTYTSEDTLPTSSSLRSYGYAEIIYNSQTICRTIDSLDSSNNTITFDAAPWTVDVTVTDSPITIYYHYKKAGGQYSYAEGRNTLSLGGCAHAEGFGSKALATGSHAEGSGSKALATGSHAEGSGSIASGMGSHAEGISTIALGATSSPQHVEGKYNIKDEEHAYAHIVGNGTSSSRSNAHTLDWSGNGWYAGKLTVGAAPTNDMDVATKQYVDQNAGVQSNWNENDSTSQAYIQNRTHYKTSLGYILPVDLIEYTRDLGADEMTFEIDGVEHTYNYPSGYNARSLPEQYGEWNFPNGGTDADLDLTVQTAELVVDGVAQNLNLGVFDDGDGYYMRVYYNADYLILYEYGNLHYCANNNTPKQSLILRLPMANECFEYTQKLDSNYLNGSLIASGSGYKSEIFNGTEGKAAIGSYSHAEGFGEVLDISVALTGDANATEYQFSDNLSYYDRGLNYLSDLGTLLDADHNPVNIGFVSISLNGNNGGYIEFTETLDAENALVDAQYYIGLPGIIASGSSSHAEGFNTIASGSYSHAEGNNTIASGSYSHAEGFNTTSSGLQCSHAEGNVTTASGYSSHAEGSGTIASGDSSHAEGFNTIASGSYSHAEGSGAYAPGYGSHAEGGVLPSTSYNYIYLTGDANATVYTVNSILIGNTNVIAILNSLVGVKVANAKIVDQTYSNGVINTITLENTLSTTAISNKRFTISSGTNTANGRGSHSEGSFNTTPGLISHAEGYFNYANGDYSHVEGYYNRTDGAGSHAEGYHTIAQRANNHVFGQYNLPDTGGTGVSTKGTYIEIVGNGTADATRSNARTLDWSGNEVLAGKLTVGAGPVNNMDVATKQYVDQNAGGDASISISNNVITLTNASGQTSSITLPVYSGAVSGGAS